MKFLFLLLFILACKKELTYTKEDLFKIAQAADPTVAMVLPRNMNEGVTCSSYPDGCLSAHIVKVRELNLIAIEYLTEKEAILASKKIRGYYTRNWVLDDVSGEPLLEEFVTKYLEAKKP